MGSTSSAITARVKGSRRAAAERGPPGHRRAMLRCTIGPGPAPATALTTVFSTANMARGCGRAVPWEVMVQRNTPPGSPPAKKKRGRPAGKAAASHPTDPNVTLIKRYGNRRLYDTRRSRYVTLEDLVEVIAAGEEIQVIDDASGEDDTKRVMTQIILLEEDRTKHSLLPVAFLRRLIQHRDESMREFFQRYLTMSLDGYIQAQKSMAERMQGFTGTPFDRRRRVPGRPRRRRPPRRPPRRLAARTPCPRSWRT